MGPPNKWTVIFKLF